MDRADVEQEVTDLLATALEFSERPRAAMLYCRHTLECMVHAVHFDQFERYPDEEAFLDFTKIMERIESGLKRQTKEILWSINAQTRSSMHWSMETRREGGAKTRHVEVVVNQISATYRDLFGSKLELIGIDIDSETIEDTIKRAVSKELSDIGIEEVSMPGEKDVNQDDLGALLDAVDAATEKGVEFDAEEEIWLANAARLAGKFELAENHLKEALQYYVSNEDRQREGVVLNDLGMVKLAKGEIDEAEQIWRKSLAMVKGAEWAWMAINNLGIIAQQRGNIDEGKQLFEESLRITQDSDQNYAVSVILANLGNTALIQGHLKEAEEYLRRSLLLKEEAEDRIGEGETLLVLARVMCSLGDTDEAIRITRECLEIGREFDARILEADGWNMMAEAMYLQNNLGEAEQSASKALSIARECNIQLIECSALLTRGRIYHQMMDEGKTERNYEVAVRDYEAAGAIAEEMGHYETGINTRNNLGLIAIDKGDLDKAERLYKEALTLAQEAGFVASSCTIIENMKELAAYRGDLDEAERLSRKSLGIRREIGNLEKVLSSLYDLAEVVEHRDQKEARRHLDESLSIARETGNRRFETEALWRLGNLGAIDETWTAEVVIERERFYGESLEIALEIGAQEIESRVYFGLGFIKWWREDYEGAVQLFRECVRILRVCKMPLFEWLIENGYTDPDAEWDFPPSIDDTEGPK